MERPGRARDDAREDERAEAGLDGVDAGGRCHALVVAGGDDDAPGPGPPQVVHQERARHQDGEDEDVEPPLVVEVDDAPQLGALEAVGHELAVQRRLGDVLLHHHREGQGGDGEVGAGDAERRQADEQRDDPTGDRRGAQDDEHVRVPVRDQVGGGDAADAHERELSEVHDAAPAGDRHERHGGEGQDHRLGGVVDLRHPAEQRDEGDRRDEQGESADPGRPDLREGPEPCRQASRHPGGAPRRVVGEGAAGGLLLEHEGEDDDGEEEDAGDLAAVGEVPLDELVHHAEPDPGGERARDRPEPGDHGRGERREEQRGATGGLERDAAVGCLQRDGEGRQHAGDGPQQDRQQVDRDAQQAGPGHVLGHAPHGDAGIAAQEEPREADEDDGHDGEEQEVVPVEHVLLGRDGDVGERRVEAGHHRGQVEPARDEEPDAAQQLGQADGGHGEDQPGGGGEPADDQPLDQGAHEGTDDHGHADAHEPGPAPAEVQRHARTRRRRCPWRRRRS